MGASTRKIAAMRTRMGSIKGTYGGRKRRAQAYSHPVLKKTQKTDKCVFVMMVLVCDTDPVWPGELWLLNLEVEKPRKSDGIEKPGCEADNSNQEEC